MRKLDPALTTILAEHHEWEAVQRTRLAADLAAAPEQPPREEASLAVEFTGDLEDLRAAGFEALTVIPDPETGHTIAAGFIPVTRLPELEDVAHIVKTEASRPLRPALNYSIPDIHADQVHNASPPLKGAGVVVGIVDTGIDFRHHAFRKPDGSTRLLAIWDQTRSPVGGEHAPAAFPNRGVELTAQDIEAALANERQAVVVSSAVTGGTFTLEFQDKTTAPIAYNATPAAVKAALEKLPDLHPGDVTVTSTTGPFPGSTAFVVAFGGTHAGLAVPELTAHGEGLTGGIVTVVSLTTVSDLEPDDLLHSGHGTHVAAIAAGDGSQSGNCRGAFTYVGVAPEAELIVVKTAQEADTSAGESCNLLHALQYIWDHPALNKPPPSTDKRPVVINVSLGDQIGAHDGTSLVEKGIDAKLAQSPGVAVVVSAGNNGNDNRHVEGTVAAGATLLVPFEVKPGDNQTRRLDLWYEGTGRLDFRIMAPPRPPTGQSPTSEVVHPGDPQAKLVPDTGLPLSRQTKVLIDSRLPAPDNNRCQIHVKLGVLSRGRLPEGIWQLELHNVSASPVAFDCWIDGQEKPPPTFTQNNAPISLVTARRTVGIPGTSKSAITVGAYTPSGFPFFTWTGDLAPFSSVGPTCDPGRTGPKPDIAAPGVGVTSAKMRVERPSCCVCCADFYWDKQGTSQAAPHVAGVVALMFQKNPTLTAADVKAHLKATARKDSDTGQVPNDRWGAGKLDAAAAVGPVTPSLAPEEPPPAPEDARPTRPVPAGQAPAAPTAPAGPGGLPGLGRGLLDGGLLDRRLLDTPEGRLGAALASRHFSEVRGLVNANPRVAARWHRMEGPRLTGLALGGAATPGELDWAALRPSVARFLDMLERYGSAELRADVRAHREAILALDPAGMLGAARRPVPVGV